MNLGRNSTWSKFDGRTFLESAKGQIRASLRRGEEEVHQHQRYYQELVTEYLVRLYFDHAELVYPETPSSTHKYLRNRSTAKILRSRE